MKTCVINGTEALLVIGEMIQITKIGRQNRGKERGQKVGTETNTKTFRKINTTKFISTTNIN